MKQNKTATLTVSEVAKILGISRGLTYQLILDSVIPYLKPSDRIAVSRIRLDKFVKKGV